MRGPLRRAIGPPEEVTSPAQQGQMPLAATPRAEAPLGPRASSHFSRFFNASPMSAGLWTTVTPAAVNACIFSSAVPCPPAMIAPAWPIRRPGGAVWPAMNPTTGFRKCALIQAAASCSALPPISPIMMTALVSASCENSCSTSMNDVPMNGSPPMPTQVDWPRPSCVN